MHIRLLSAVHDLTMMFKNWLLQVRLQAAGQDGEAVTEILFWDGPEEGISTYKYQPEAEFVNCGCCYVEPIPQVNSRLHVLTIGQHLGNMHVISTVCEVINV